MLEDMKSIRILFAVVCACSMLAGAAVAADQKTATRTCCEQAAAKGKECRHKCCVAAHKEGKSCAVCNPQEQDLKVLKKNSKKSDPGKASNATAK